MLFVVRRLNVLPASLRHFPHVIHKRTLSLKLAAEQVSRLEAIVFEQLDAASEYRPRISVFLVN